MLTWRNFQQEVACRIQRGRKASLLHPAARLQAALHREERRERGRGTPTASRASPGSGWGAETLRGRSTARAAPGLPSSESSDLNSPSTQGQQGGHREPQQQRLGEHGGRILPLPPSPAAPRGPPEPEAAAESSLSSARPLLVNHLHPAEVRASGTARSPTRRLLRAAEAWLGSELTSALGRGEGKSHLLCPPSLQRGPASASAPLQAEQTVRKAARNEAKPDSTKGMNELENENKSSGGGSLSESPARGRGHRTQREVPGATAVPAASSSASCAQPSLR